MSEKLEIKEFIIGLLSTAAIFATVLLSAWGLLDDPMLRQAVTFSAVAQVVGVTYPVPIAEENAFAYAERALLDCLDPFSMCLGRGEYSQLIEESTGEYSGVGITVVPRDTALMVMSVREGGPAYQAGMKAGDLILRVDGRLIPREDPNRAVGQIRGPSGSQVTLTVWRSAAADTLSLVLTRRNLRLEHLPYRGLTDNRAAYVRMADFEAGAAEDLKQAVAELEKQDPAGYIIDLESNPGGFLNEAILAAEIFLERGTLIVGIDSRSRWDNRRYSSRSHPLTERPVVILTDRGTASAAEIFTGALHGAGRAAVVGDTTFGKGLVQSVFQMPGGDAFRLTTSRYYFADGRYLNPPDSELNFDGLAPDIVFREEGEAAFREMVLSGFLIYDFVESQAAFLASFPDGFDYPDTVVAMFADFAGRHGYEYHSWLTETLALARIGLLIDSASVAVMGRIDDMMALSKSLDRDVYDRHAGLVKFSLRMVAVEQKSGREAAYRHVIVPGRPEIRLAEQLLLDPEQYRKALSPPQVDDLAGGK